MKFSIGIANFLLNMVYIHDTSQLRYMQQKIYLKEKFTIK